MALTSSSLCDSQRHCNMTGLVRKRTWGGGEGSGARKESLFCASDKKNKPWMETQWAPLSLLWFFMFFF